MPKSMDSGDDARLIDDTEVETNVSKLAQIRIAHGDAIVDAFHSYLLATEPEKYSDDLTKQHLKNTIKDTVFGALHLPHEATPHQYIISQQATIKTVAEKLQLDLVGEMQFIQENYTALTQDSSIKLEPLAAFMAGRDDFKALIDANVTSPTPKDTNYYEKMAERILTSQKMIEGTFHKSSKLPYTPFMAYAEKKSGVLYELNLRTLGQKQPNFLGKIKEVGPEVCVAREKSRGANFATFTTNNLRKSLGLEGQTIPMNLEFQCRDGKIQQLSLAEKLMGKVTTKGRSGGR